MTNPFSTVRWKVAALALTLPVLSGCKVELPPSGEAPTFTPLAAQLASDPKLGPLGPGVFSSDEQETLRLINEARARGATCTTGGVTTVMPPVPPLRMEGHLHLAARRHAKDMKARSYLTHDARDTTDSPAPYGVSFDARIHATNLATARVLGENLGLGHDTPQGAVADWLASTQGHCNTLMDPAFTLVGVAVSDGTALRGQSGFANTWAASFSSPPFGH